MNLRTLVVASAAMLMAPSAWAGFITFESAGANPAAITPMRDSFRAAVGGGTVAGSNGSFGGLRREINWDAVPNSFAAPNNLPLNFFNANSPRGVVFSTPGTGIAVSANAVTGLIEFDNINPIYSQIFQTFSAQRLFAVIGSNVVDVSFFETGTNNAGYTSAFGSIFTDVDRLNTTAIEYFDGAVSLGRFAVPVANNGLSFLGVRFDAGERITRVRIINGNAAFGPTECANVDVVAMDDFIYAEPLRTVVPEPSSLALVGLGLIGCLARFRRQGIGSKRQDI